jgi:hypothetical protein
MIMKAIVATNSLTKFAIYDVRRPDDVSGYADWAKARAFVGAMSNDLPRLAITDVFTVVGQRKSDGFLPGCDNQIWLIDDTQADAAIAASAALAPSHEQLNQAAAINAASEKSIAARDEAMRKYGFDDSGKSATY